MVQKKIKLDIYIFELYTINFYDIIIIKVIHNNQKGLII